MSLYLDVAAALILTLIILTAGLRRLTQGTANRTLLMAVAMTLVTTVLDIITVKIDGLPGLMTLQYAANELYLLFHVLSATFYLFYLISVADTWHKLNRSAAAVLMLVVPLVVFAFILFTSRHTGLLLYIDGNGCYHRGSMFFLAYVISGLYLVLSVITMFTYRRLFSCQIIGILIAPYPILLIAMTVQLIWPNMLVEMFADSFSLLLVWCNIQRPEELLDPVTGLGNRTTYLTTVKRAIEVEKPLYILRIEIRKISEIQEAYGSDASGILMKQVADKLRYCDKAADTHAYICHNRERVFFMLIKERYFDKAEELGRMLASELQFIYSYAEVRHSVHSYLCLYRIPQDIHEFSLIGNLGNLFLERDIKQDYPYTAEKLFCEKKYRLCLDINKVINEAIQNDRFELYYQPIYDFKKRRFVGAEELLRLNDDQYGYVSPEYIVTAAEENGMMYRLDRIILRRAFEMLSKYHPEKYGLRSLDINLSMTQCRQIDLADSILTMARDYGVRPEMLNLEITETAAEDLSEPLMNNFRKLREAGVRLSIDDFGKGYSNLRQIVKFPLNVVKLDQSLADVTGDKTLAALSRNIIPMLREMQFETLIEGVENEEQARAFELLGCNYCQGYYYAKPMNETAFISFMRRQSDAAWEE